jgi:hypothetical protein
LLNIDGTAISVVDGFKVPSSPQTPSLLIYLLFIGGMGLIAGFILGLFYEIEKKVSRNNLKSQVDNRNLTLYMNFLSNVKAVIERYKKNILFNRLLLYLVLTYW